MKTILFNATLLLFVVYMFFPSEHVAAQTEENPVSIALLTQGEVSKIRGFETMLKAELENSNITSNINLYEVKDVEASIFDEYDAVMVVSMSKSKKPMRKFIRAHKKNEKIVILIFLPEGVDDLPGIAKRAIGKNALYTKSDINESEDFINTEILERLKEMV